MRSLWSLIRSPKPSSLSTSSSGLFSKPSSSPSSLVTNGSILFMKLFCYLLMIDSVLTSSKIDEAITTWSNRIDSPLSPSRWKRAATRFDLSNTNQPKQNFLNSFHSSKNFTLTANSISANNLGNQLFFEVIMFNWNEVILLFRSFRIQELIRPI